MANNCYFEMKIAGKEQAVEEFVRMLKWQDEFSQKGLGRIFSFDVDPGMTVKHSNRPDLISVFGYGDCAWSLKTALVEWTPRALLDVTERLGLVVEAYSSEPGCCFQEHYLVNKDEIVIEDCVDYQEYLIDGATEEYIQEVMEEHHLTREELMAKVDHNGDFTVGGFDYFGDFEDLFSYLTQKQIKWYDRRDPRTNEQSWWTQRDENSNCFEVKFLPISKRFRLYVNEIKSADYDSLSQAMRAAEAQWNRSLTPQGKPALNSLVENAQSRAGKPAQEAPVKNHTPEGR